MPITSMGSEISRDPPKDTFSSFQGQTVIRAMVEISKSFPANVQA